MKDSSSHWRSFRGARHFYLVFLVESEGEHSSSILLLDEPGLSLHPLAQRNLSDFFESLSTSNQLIYTTHSPFLVDADRLDRARKVFIDADGTTKATGDLRSQGGNAQQVGASYAVHSALNLSVSESFLVGCRPVIVEGPSDQHYLSAIKQTLIAASLIAPTREIVFPPSGGVKTAQVVASILTGRDETLPLMLLDGDQSGLGAANSLRAKLYVEKPDRIALVPTYTGLENSEIEDLVEPHYLANVVDRWQRNTEVFFSDKHDENLPIIPQIERWASSEGIELEKGWKVELALAFKRRLLDQGPSKVSDDRLQLWKSLFDWIETA